MKKLLFTLTLLLMLVLVGCSNKKDSNKIYVGLECAYAPFNYTQNDNTNGAVQIYNSNYKALKNSYANGYDVMIAKKIAESLGKELVIVQLEWDALIPAVNAGTIDFIIAGMSPTDERKESIDFSDKYYTSNLVVVVRKDGAYASATSLSDLSGAKLVAQSGTFHDDALNAQGSTYNITRQTPMETFPAMINALNTRVVDGYIAEEPGAIENCASNPDFTYIRLTNNGTGFTVSDSDVAIAVGLKKGSSILSSVNTALSAISQADRDQMMNTAITLASGDNIVE